MRAPGLMVVVAGCSAGASAPGAVAPRPPVAAEIAAACQAAEHRQLDFWIGAWDVTVRAAAAPGAPWAEARGTQHIEAILGGCAIAEAFDALGPGVPWSGRSYSMWQPASGQWRQTWVDDQGSYIALTGGLEQGVMTLVGEPREVEGKPELKRMVFLDVTPTSMRWEWQRSVDGGPWEARMIIDYRRRAAR
jgi:hypothetical protein